MKKSLQIHPYFYHIFIFFGATLPHCPRVLQLLTMPWGDDEQKFLKLVPALNLSDLATYFNPEWGWYFRPAFLLYFGLVRRLFGDSMIAFYAFNLLLHGLAALLLVRVAARLGSKYPLAIGGLFLLSTYSNQAPVWISAITIIFVLVVALLAIDAWLSFVESEQRRFYWLAVGATAFALCSKEESVILPALLLLLDFWKRPQLSLKSRLSAHFPFWLLLAVYLPLALIANQHQKVFLTSMPAEKDPSVVLLILNHSLFDALGIWNTLFNIFLFGFIVWHLRGAARLSWLWLIISALPIGLTMGVYAIDSRFWYLSSALAALALVLMLESIFADEHSPSPIAVLCAGASVLLIPITSFILTQSDSRLSQLTGVALAILAATIAWRLRQLKGELVLILCLLILASELDGYILDRIASWDNWFSLLAVAIATWLTTRMGWRLWHGMLVCTFLLTSAFVTIPAFLTALLFATKTNPKATLQNQSGT